MPRVDAASGVFVLGLENLDETKFKKIVNKV